MELDAILQPLRDFFKSILCIKFFCSTHDVLCILEEEAVTLSSEVVFDRLLQLNIPLIQPQVFLVESIQQRHHFGQHLLINWFMALQKVEELAELFHIPDINASCHQHLASLFVVGRSLWQFMFNGPLSNTGFTSETMSIFILTILI